MAYNIDVLKDSEGNLIRPATITDNVINPSTKLTVTQELNNVRKQLAGLTIEVLDSVEVYEAMLASDLVEDNVIYLCKEE